MLEVFRTVQKTQAKKLANSILEAVHRNLVWKTKVWGGFHLLCTVFPTWKGIYSGHIVFEKVIICNKMRWKIYKSQLNISIIGTAQKNSVKISVCITVKSRPIIKTERICCIAKYFQAKSENQIVIFEKKKSQLCNAHFYPLPKKLEKNTSVRG